MNYDLIASQLLIDPLILQSLVHAVIEAGQVTVLSKIMQKFKHAMCVLPLGLKGVNREIKPLILYDKEVEIEYKWQDITVVGGCVINALNFHTQRDLGAYFPNLTSDIDIVWWPSSIKGMSRIAEAAKIAPFLDQEHFGQYPPYIKPFDTVYATFFDESIRKQTVYSPVSSSGAIVALAHIMGENMEKQLNDSLKRTHLVERIHAIIGHRVQLHFEVESSLASSGREMFASIKSGSWNLRGILHVGKLFKLKLIDLAIHDMASSQKTPEKILQDPTTDPIYVSTERDLILHMKHLPFTPFLPIPRLNVFAYQQFFGLINRMVEYREGKLSREKVQMHHRRIQYIYDLFVILYDHSKHYGFHRTPYVSMLLDVLEMGKIPQSFFYDNLKTKIPQHPDWIASCPWSLDYCRISPQNPTLADLCAKNLMFHSSLCGPGPGRSVRGTSARSRSPSGRTVRAKSPSFHNNGRTPFKKGSRRQRK